MAAKKAERSMARKMFGIVMILMPCAAILGLVLFFFQMASLEQGILNVCAEQQDAHVELVVSQINLKDNRNNVEIITDILGTLDASGNKFWTFSNDQTMLFVKDVSETNKYKGYSASSYYSSESAEAFFENLSLDRVTHTNIVVAEKEYVASGMAFSYQGSPYKLCLLTNRDVLLDNNSFLEAKAQMWTLMVFYLALLAAITMILAIFLRRIDMDKEETEATLTQVRLRMTEMSERLNRREMYDTKNGLWSAAALPRFLEGLRQKGVKKASLVKLHCKDQISQLRFLAKAKFMLDHRVLRFSSGKTDLILLFLDIDSAAAAAAVKPMLTEGVELLKTETVGMAGVPVALTENDPN